jgi:hypothetical protein
VEGAGNTWNAFHLFPPVAGLVCSSFHLFPPLSTYAPGQFDSSRSCALSKSEIPRKVSGTEPDFVQKLGTEPNFERKKAERRALLCEFDPETYKTSAASDARMAALVYAEQCSALRENASLS